MSRAWIFALVFSYLPLFGCSSTPEKEPPPPPTRIDLQVEAGADVNPDSNGQGAPLQLRIYELKGVAAFNAADFFAIYDKDQATLGADLVSKKELILKPGETKSLMLDAESATQAVGFVAAYRKLDDAIWRASVPVAEHQTITVRVTVKANQLAVEQKPAPTPAPAK